MKYKKFIIGGCSFTEEGGWADCLRDYSRQFNKNIEFVNTAIGAQGNDLIQKKCFLELVESLERYAPDEIAVFVMWSGTERKAYYIDNPQIINKDDKSILKDQHRFLNLKNQVNEQAGWLLTNTLGLNEGVVHRTNVTLANSDKYFVHNTLENMILLQSICKLHNVKLYQNFYMSYVYSLIETVKNDDMVRYLHKHLDYSTFIDNKNIIYEFLKTQNNDEAFLRKDNHPTKEGYDFYWEQILLPKLTNDGFFNG